MKAKLLSITAVLIITLIIAGCEKNGTGADISLKLKSVNATEFHRNDRVVFKFDFTPATAEEDTLFVKRKFYSCTFDTAPDSVAFKFPPYTTGGKGELEYSFVYAPTSGASGGTFFDGCYNQGAGVRRTDSLQYTFWIKDKDGNISDTVRSPKIILYNN